MLRSCLLKELDTMSEFTDKSREEKQETLKEIIRELHAGAPVSKLQKKFRKLIVNTAPDEIAAMENSLIEEGFPPEEIQRLCDVHAKVFDEALSKVGKPGKIPGHPVYTYVEENKAARNILAQLSKLSKKLKKKNPLEQDISGFKKEFDRLKEIEKHFQRKENQLFPVLEKMKFTGPAKVMWGKHDEIRVKIKSAETCLENRDWAGCVRQVKDLSSAIRKLIFLEEKILYPTSVKKLSDREWAEIKRGEKEIGYAWVTPSNLWDANLAQSMAGPETAAEDVTDRAAGSPILHEKEIKLAEGTLTEEQIRLMLKVLPLDITFVDENDRVQFYSATEHRIFPRSPAIIGRAVQNCHPPKSVHVVENIIKSFREKKKDVAEFWIRSGGKFIHIRYFPVYNDKGDYKGVIEVTQEVSGIRDLEGERRILDW